MIGVKGAPAGTAHESYSVSGTTDTVQNYLQALTGTLMVDGNSHYNFVPDGDAEFQAVSGASPQIMVGPYTFTPPREHLQNNVFWLVVLDRQTLQPINFPIVNEAGEASSTACQAVAGAQSCGSLFAADYGIYPDGGGADLAATLSGISPRNLIFLTTQGCPFKTEDPSVTASASLGTALQNIGGMRYSVNALIERDTFDLRLQPRVRQRRQPSIHDEQGGIVGEPVRGSGPDRRDSRLPRPRQLRTVRRGRQGPDDGRRDAGAARYRPSTTRSSA